jgi:hypothetical protein
MVESEQLRRARTTALDAIERHAQSGELREAAWQLGSALLAAADDEQACRGDD